MERSKQIQVGLLVMLAILLLANVFFKDGLKSLFQQSEASKIRESAAASALTGKSDGSMTAMPPVGDNGNIPGMNVNSQVSNLPPTAIQYDNEKFNFGVADEGDIVKHSFKFKNVGAEPLVISNCKGSCGCTVPTWPKEPIPPGGSGEINIEFNTKGKPGMQSKRVTVTANTNPTETYLEISGEVRGKEQPAAKGSTKPNQ